jgi:hypothetical protein
MSTMVTASARLTAQSRQHLREQLGLSLDPAAELDRLSSILESGMAGLPALQQMIGTTEASMALTALAPVEFGELTSLLADAGNLGEQTLAESLQSGLAEAVAVADARITAAARDMTANAFAESGAELGYTAWVFSADAATGVELRRDHEVVLVRVHDDGAVDFDHAGLFDAACGERQLQLERGAERRGVVLTQRNQRYHKASGGGELIAAAGASGDPSLARATALAAAPRTARQAPALRRIGDTPASGRRRAQRARRGGMA